MATTGLRELRQDASALVRRAEHGEQITITVSGRPAAQLGPVAGSRAWRRLEELTDLFDDTTDPAWADDRDAIDQTVTDPFSR